MVTPRTAKSRQTPSRHLASAEANSSESTVASTYRLDQYRKECKITPFVLDLGETQIVIPPPTGDTVISISETPIYAGRVLLQLICGEQFDAVWDAIKDEPGGVLVGLLQDLGQHFMVAQISAAPGGPVALPS